MRSILTLNVIFSFKAVNKPLKICKSIKRFNSSLAEVGFLENPKQQGKYGTGQLFLHSVFGYRGVILFPWIGKIYDRDLARTDEKPSSSSTSVSKDMKGRTHTYYQVLIDSRDSPFVRVGTESVTFLSNQQNNGTLYSIPGLDYVSHEDILPYKTSEAVPFINHLFDKFFVNDASGKGLIAQDFLHQWQTQNFPWLELTDVHRETTKNIRITVMPFFIGTSEIQQNKVYWWRYCIRLENLAFESVQLRERHWRIFSLSGTLETVRGRGIIGQEPIFSKSQPAFQYTSHVSLQAPSGHMWGTFKMESSNGSHFECRIPPFTLESRSDEDNNTGNDGNDGGSPKGFLT